MADDEPNDDDNEFFDISKLSEAERRRLKRRQRILDNQGARLQRILKTDSKNQKEVDVNTEGEKAESDKPVNANDVPTTSRSGIESIDNKTGTGVVGDSKNARERIPKNVISSDNSPVEIFPRRSASSGNSRIESSPVTPASILQELSDVGLAQDAPTGEIRMGVQSDGTVILPKISQAYGRALICLLALFLSIMNAKRRLVTFISLEVAYYFLSGLPPLPPPNMAMVLAAVMGLQEKQLIRVKKILHFGNCVMIDFSLFLVFTLMPQFIRNVISF